MQEMWPSVFCMAQCCPLSHSQASTKLEVIKPVVAAPAEVAEDPAEAGLTETERIKLRADR